MPIAEPTVGGSPADVTDAEASASATHRIRSVLAIRPFRRLWAVTAVASFGDWLSLLALTALATQLTSGYQAQSFALGGVVATKLLPALFMAPLGGVLADKFDRRTVMVTCDVLKALLFLSIPLVGSLWWLFAATFLIELCALCWIPAKDSSVPNLLKRSDQVETANQLSLVMTYGVAVISAAGAFALISKSGNIAGWNPSPTTTVYLALVVNGLAALLTAFTVAFRIPEISGRSAERREAAPGLLAMLRDGAQFVSTTPLVRGLVVGIIGAFAAGGAVIASARLYAASLGGGDAAYSVLFIALFSGLALGMATVPRMARRMPHHRLFGVAIVGAGTSLLAVAIAWHLYLALATVVLVGFFAGTALLTGLTIIGAQVEDAVRGRVVAFVQSIVRVDLLASMSVVPLLVGLVQSRTLTLFGQPAQVDGTRFVLFGAGIVAAAVGVLAYRQMDDRRDRTILADVKRALRRSRHGEPGLLVAVEGARAPTPTCRATCSWRGCASRVPTSCSPVAAPPMPPGCPRPSAPAGSRASAPGPSWRPRYAPTCSPARSCRPCARAGSSSSRAAWTPPWRGWATSSTPPTSSASAPGPRVRCVPTSRCCSTATRRSTTPPP